MAESKEAVVRFSVAGLILVFFGVLFLLQSLGVVSWAIWGTLWRFWPVILIVLGLGILWGSRNPLPVLLLSLVLLVGPVVIAIVIGGGTSSPGPVNYSLPLSRVERTQVEINVGAGDLMLGSLPESSQNLVEASAAPDMSQDFRISGGTGILALTVPGQHVIGAPIGQRIRLEADLSTRVPVELRVKTGASTSQVDLKSLKVTKLTLDIGASRLDLQLPSNAGATDATVKAGVAEVHVTIPLGVAARISLSSGLSSVSIDSRFPKIGAVYQSADYATASNKVDLRIDAGVSSIVVR